MAVLSIQSAVAYGYVGNSVAAFALQRLGHEVWPVDTVQFSNHSGYGAWRGRAWDAATIAEVIRGIGERGQFGRCRAVLSGYLGEAALGEVVLDAVAEVKSTNPDAVYCCDPVIGDDHGGVFVRPGIAEFLRDRALPAADLITPNRFELALLSGLKIAGVADGLAAAMQLRARGPRLVLMTSLPGPAENEIGMMVATNHGAWMVATPRLPVSAHGAGDLTAAVFLGHFLATRDPAAALSRTAGAVHAVLEATQRADMPELQIISAQAQLADPPRRFEAMRVA